MKTRFGTTLLVLLFLFAQSCSHSYVQKAKKNSIAIRSVNLLAVAYHRPDYPPAREDDFSRKDRKLECSLSADFWKEITDQHQSVNSCLNDAGFVGLTYRLVMETLPYLEVDQNEKKNPDCVKKLLPKIPLPREIYFLGTEALPDPNNRSRMGCYSVGFNVLSGLVFSTHSPTKVNRILFPALADRPLKSKQDLQLWLMTTVFSILKADEQAQGKLWALPVPDAVCRSCFQADPRFNEKNSGEFEPVFWP